MKKMNKKMVDDCKIREKGIRENCHRVSRIVIIHNRKAFEDVQGTMNNSALRNKKGDFSNLFQIMLWAAIFLILMFAIYFLFKRLGG